MVSTILGSMVTMVHGAGVMPVTIHHGITTMAGMTHGITTMPVGMILGTMATAAGTIHGTMATVAGMAGGILTTAGMAGAGQEAAMSIMADTQERATIGGMVHVDFQEKVMSQCMAVGPQMEIFGDIEEATVATLPQVNIEEMVLAHGAIPVILDSEEHAHVVRVPITSLVPVCHEVPLAEVQAPSVVVPSVALAVEEARSAEAEAVVPLEEEDNSMGTTEIIIVLIQHNDEKENLFI